LFLFIDPEAGRAARIATARPGNKIRVLSQAFFSRRCHAKKQN